MPAKRRSKTAHDRGEYRSFYAAMTDDPAFKRLSSDAFKLLFCLRLTIGAAGIGILRPLVLADQMGMTPEQLEPLLAELEAVPPGATHGWIVREDNAVWIVNALRDEPTLFSNNEKHRPFVQRQVSRLGDRPIVRSFRDRYPDWFDGVRSPTVDDTVPSTVGGTVSHAVLNTLAEPNRSTNTVTSDSDTSDNTNNEHETERSALEALIARFLDRYYADSSAERREGVRTDLLNLAHGSGVQIRAGVMAHARSVPHLQSVLEDVIATPPRDPDKAIVIVLKKLGDPETDEHGRTATEAASARIRDEIVREERETAGAVAKWIEDHPAEYASLEREAAERFPGNGPFQKPVREGWLRGAIMKLLSPKNRGK